MMSVADWLAIGLALLGIPGAVIVYWFQKRLDRSSEQQREKRQIYQDYLDALHVYRLRTIRTDHEGRRSAVETFLSKESAVLVFAPAEVAKETLEVSRKFLAYIDAHRGKYEPTYKKLNSDEFQEVEAAFSEALDRLLRLMRRDVLSEDQVISGVLVTESERMKGRIK